MTSRIGLLHSLAVGLGLGLAACSSPTGLDLIPEATVSCAGETATADQQLAGSSMLPGRVCGGCHRSGGQAANSPWTVSGTVYPTKDAACNGTGRAGITVQILYGIDDPQGHYHVDDPQPKGDLTTNAAGNFYTADKFVAPMHVRIFDPNNRTAGLRMNMPVGQDPTTGATSPVDCNTCHYPGSPNLPGTTYGRVYLP